MSAEKEILEYLDKNRRARKYKGIRVNIFGLPDFKYYKYQTLANGCSILKKRGYIKKDKLDNYYITFKGKKFLESGMNLPKVFNSNNKKDDTKNLLIIYDIPQENKKEGDWFRRHLKKFHFIMIQKSVWVGPSPLPPEFVAYVKEIKLGDSFKTFKLAKGYGNK